MKKILSVLLVATMLCAMFAITSSAAAANVNAALDAKYLEPTVARPVMDGIVERGEYGNFNAPLSFSNESQKDQFATDLDQYGDWTFDFHIAWDADKLYMAWVVETDIHQPFIKGNHTLEDGTVETGYMYKYSCVQFILTPGEPDASVKKYQTGEWNGNYLEVGLCLMDDGEETRIAWSYPTGVSATDVALESWDAAIVRDESAKTTTYEVAIPWEMTGVAMVGTDAKFGLTFAVGAQYDYDIKNGMIEWNDAIIGGKKADNSGIITLAGGNEDIIQHQKVEGTLPEEANGKIQLVIDKANEKITGDDSVIITDPAAAPEGGFNTVWTYNMLLKPVEGEDGVYELIAAKQGDGVADVAFDEYEEGMIIYAIHSNQVAGTPAETRITAARNLLIGSKFKTFGLNFAAPDPVTYTNSMFYVIEAVQAPDTTPTPAPGGDDNTSKDESEDASKPAASTADTSVAEEEDSNIVLWVVIAIVAVAAVAAVVVVVLKKKKA